MVHIVDGSSKDGGEDLKVCEDGLCGTKQRERGLLETHTGAN